MAAKRYAATGDSLGSQLGPHGGLDDTDEHGKLEAAYDFLFTFSSNRGYISLGLRDPDLDDECF